LHDFIIPEIQREYVWGSPNNSEIVLKPFLQSVKDSAQVDEHCHYAHGQENLHIGFLYSYKPQYIKDISDRIVDEYLIDGQQRFTSLFLLLLVRAITEDRLVDFNNIIRWEDGNIAFDYKVRQLTHLFIYELIKNVQEDGAKVLADIEKGDFPYWLMNDYLNDTTVNNIIGAIRCILEVFDDKESLYYDYLLTRIHFWHFKTDVTSQGEELYITMNSRGEELSNNEVQKARRLNSTDQSKWGPLWEDWQTFFWRSRNKGNVKNFDADKGFNNLLSCIDAMGASFGVDYSKIQDTKTAVSALKYIVETDWDNILSSISTLYNTGWILSLKDDVWARINSTSAKWFIEKDSDTTQRENAVLLWPLFYYYFEQNKNNKAIDKMTFIRMMHLCYLNYKSKKTNHAFIKDFVEALCTSGGNMLTLSALSNKSFLSEENIEFSELIAIATNPDELESLIWDIQHKPYFLDGEDVGGETIKDYIKSIQSSGIDIYKGLHNLGDNYDILFPSSDPDKNKVLLKRILLHYKGSNNELFWKQMSPYYDRNYETSSWKRIVRHETFLMFYVEITNCHSKVISQNDLENFVIYKQNQFFSEDRNRDFITSKWSDRRIAILVDYVTGGDLWNKDRYEDLGFSEDANSIGKPFIGNTWIGNRVCGSRKQWQKVSLPANWDSKLQNQFNTYSFNF
jgi:uncharacterized protein with ParB-like and HNH nuclease domain